MIELQTNSYAEFLQADLTSSKRQKHVGLESVFREVFPIQSYDGKVVLDYSSYEIGAPKVDWLECLREGTTYGAPLLTGELQEVHLARIHLLVIEPSLTDYHHVHPQPTAVPGEYAFAFTPRKTGAYRIWADIRPAPMNLQEYALADLPGLGPTSGLNDRTSTSRVRVDGFEYELTFTTPTIKAGVVAIGRLRVSGPDGRGFEQLEPLMGAYAHLVGFHEDFQTVLHLHPRGAPASGPQARGGPELEFQIYAVKPGFYRLFAQVQIGGISRFAPFGIQVLP